MCLGLSSFSILKGLLSLFVLGVFLVHLLGKGFEELAADDLHVHEVAEAPAHADAFFELSASAFPEV